MPLNFFSFIVKMNKWQGYFTGHMLFLYPNQHCQSINYRINRDVYI